MGTYSQGIKLGDLLFVSGCVPFDPATGDVVPGGIEEQAKRALQNMKGVVEASGNEIGKVVKTTASHLLVDSVRTSTTSVGKRDEACRIGLYCTRQTGVDG
ncbi:hypothetical protein OE88DRAFT_1649634 [Heliocybe sulcata]|uniref:YjgF-like protein n=1 Tax=Heliocybe sulcata TaxID=5364 RepID=A0A5C3NHK3_9AGAM|nr:hypothetical protein OE88DRAFT_1649634 [Heliocybe sulcata]